MRSEVQKVGQIKPNGHCLLPPRPLSIQPATFGRQTQISQLKSAAFICASALVSSLLLQITFRRICVEFIY